MREWFVVDPKHPWREIKIRNAKIKSGEKLAWIEYSVKSGNRMDKKRSIVGMSAFPFMSGAIASQNQRCLDLLHRTEKIKGIPHIHIAREDCLNRLYENGDKSLCLTKKKLSTGGKRP